MFQIFWRLCPKQWKLSLSEILNRTQKLNLRLQLQLINTLTEATTPLQLNFSAQIFIFSNSINWNSSPSSLTVIIIIYQKQTMLMHKSTSSWNSPLYIQTPLMATSRYQVICRHLLTSFWNSFTISNQQSLQPIFDKLYVRIKHWNYRRYLCDHLNKHIWTRVDTDGQSTEQLCKQ